MKLRLLNKIIANLLGYFWLPCPNCGQMFGGHEHNGFKCKMVNGHAMIVCPHCQSNPNFKSESPIPTWDMGKILEKINPETPKEKRTV